MRKIIPIILMPMFLQGCALGIGEPDFGCEGLEEGTRCMSTREVYEATNNSDRVHVDDAGNLIEPETGVDTAALSSQSGDFVRPPRVDGPRVIRTPSKVMRVWIAPYEDRYTDLHFPGLVFTEIEPRRWEIGASIPETVTQKLVPLQVSRRAETNSGNARDARNPNKEISK